MTLQQAEQLIAILAASYPHTAIGGETVGMYSIALADCTADEGAEIVMHWTATERRWPQISELRALVAKARGEIAPDHVEAWREVRLSFGSSTRKPWSHPAIGEAVDAIGYREIGQSTEPEIMRAQFERYYKTACARHVPSSTRDFTRALVDKLKQRTALDGRPVPLLGGGKR